MLSKELGEGWRDGGEGGRISHAEWHFSNLCILSRVRYSYLTVIGCDMTNPESVNEKVIAQRLADNTRHASFLFNANCKRGTEAVWSHRQSKYGPLLASPVGKNGNFVSLE